MKKSVDIPIIVLVLMLSFVAVANCRDTCGTLFGVQLYCPSGYHCCSPDTSYCCAYGYICAADKLSCISIGAIAGPIVGFIVVLIIVIIVIVKVKNAKAARLVSVAMKVAQPAEEE